LPSSKTSFYDPYISHIGGASIHFFFKRGLVPKLFVNIGFRCACPIAYSTNYFERILRSVRNTIDNTVIGVISICPSMVYLLCGWFSSPTFWDVFATGVVLDSRTSKRRFVNRKPPTSSSCFIRPNYCQPSLHLFSFVPVRDL
jgi:hypothetical protein